jgi:hypothetical protein
MSSGEARIFLNAVVSASVYPAVLFQFFFGFARSDYGDQPCTKRIVVVHTHFGCCNVEIPSPYNRFFGVKVTNIGVEMNIPLFLLI